MARQHVCRVGDSEAHSNVDETNSCMAELGASKDVGEEVDLVLNVLLRSQASEVATHKDIEVDLVFYTYVCVLVARLGN